MIQQANRWTVTLYNSREKWGKGMSRKALQKYLGRISLTENKKGISSENVSQRICKWTWGGDGCKLKLMKVEWGVKMKAPSGHTRIWISMGGRCPLKDFKHATWADIYFRNTTLTNVVILEKRDSTDGDNIAYKKWGGTGLKH